MARIIYSSLSDKKWIGPFPNKAGEFCLNVLQRDIILDEDGTTVISSRRPLTSLRLDDKKVEPKIGPPSSCLEGTSEQMSARGYAGLYLKEDQPVLEDEEDVDTDIFHEEVVTGKRPPNKPFTLKRSKGL